MKRKQLSSKRINRFVMTIPPPGVRRHDGSQKLILEVPMVIRSGGASATPLNAAATGHATFSFKSFLRALGFHVPRFTAAEAKLMVLQESVELFGIRVRAIRRGMKLRYVSGSIPIHLS